jgi:hypothetical protein
MFFSRGPNKIQDPYTLKDIYYFYANEIEGSKIYNIEYSEYVNIVTDFYKDMMDHILLRAGTFYLTFGLGKISVIKAKLKLENIDHKQLDWKTTNEIGKRVYHLNEHSSGYKYLFEWNKRGSKIKKLYLYRFQLTRGNKRRLAQLIKSGEYDYYEKR